MSLRDIQEDASRERASRLIEKLSFKVKHGARHLGSVIGLGALPDFLVIGAQRCGTTSLYDYLVGHPNIVPALRKEVHYFDNNYDRTRNWYKAFFPLQGLNIPEARSGLPLRGEATPYYVFHPRAPNRIARALPEIKLIAMLRNPVDRAYSHYQHEIRRGYEHLPFEEAIAKERERIGWDAERLLQDGGYRSIAHQHFSYLSRGVYHQQLRRYLDGFDTAQIMVVISEDFFAHPGKTLAQILRFLGVDPGWRPERFVKCQHYGPYPPMKPAIREYLASYFQPHNARLSKLLSIELDWD